MVEAGWFIKIFTLLYYMSETFHKLKKKKKEGRKDKEQVQGRREEEVGLLLISCYFVVHMMWKAL